MFLRNVAIYLQVHTALQLTWRTLTSSPQWGPQTPVRLSNRSLSISKQTFGASHSSLLTGYSGDWGSSRTIKIPDIRCIRSTLTVACLIQRTSNNSNFVKMTVAFTYTVFPLNVPPCTNRSWISQRPFILGTISPKRCDQHETALCQSWH
jgi:hypothetical protein